MMRQIARMVAALVLMGLLAACGGARPPQALVEQAVTLQVSQTQQQLSQQLRSKVSSPGVTIDHVKVKKQQAQTVNAAAGYRVEGTYDLTLSTPQPLTRRQNPFEVYLVERDGNWQLARPLLDRAGQTTWEMQVLPGEPQAD